MKKTLCCTVLCAGAAGQAFAAPQSYDSCATPLPVNGVSPMIVAIDGSSATREASTPLATCGPSPRLQVDLWFLYTANITGLTDIQITAGCPSNGVSLSVWNTCAPSGTETPSSCVANICSTPYTLSVVANQTYLLRTVTYSQTSTSVQRYISATGQLTITEQVPPANDLCSNAQVIGINTIYPFSTQYAGTEYNPTCEAGTLKDVFFDFIAPTSAIYQFDAIGSTSVSPHLTLIDETCGGAVSECGFATTGPGNGTRMVRAMFAGERVLLRLANPSGRNNLFGKVVVTPLVRPLNDACADAQAVSLGTTTFNNTGTSDDDETICGVEAGRYDVFFSFTPTVTGVYRVDTCGSAFYSAMQLLDVCGADPIICQGISDATTYGACEKIITPTGIIAEFRAGVTHLIRIANRGQAETGLGKLNISMLSTGTIPSNDACSTAQALSVGQTVTIESLNYASHTPADGVSSCSFGLTNSPDVWYTFTPNFSGTVRISTCDAATKADTTLSLHTSCGSPSVDCNDNGCISGRSEIVYAVTSGTSYWIRVGYSKFTLLAGVNLKLEQVSGTIPTNDTCATTANVTSPTTAFDNTLAGTELPIEQFFPTYRDLWYSYTAPANGSLVLTTSSNATGTRLPMRVHNACNGTVLAEETGFSTLSAPIFLCVTSGQTIKIRVGQHISSSFTGVVGPSTLIADFSPTQVYIAPPANAASEPETCAGRTAVGTGVDTINGGFPAPNGYSPISCGVTYKGTLPQGSNWHDKDYFLYPIADGLPYLVLGSANAPLEVNSQYVGGENDGDIVIATTGSCSKTFSAVFKPFYPEYGTNGLLRFRSANESVTGACGTNEEYWFSLYHLDGTIAISTQPVNRAVANGATTTFTVAAPGSGLSYQWRRGTTVISNGGNISGATSATLTVSNVSAVDIASYSVIVSNGCSATISSSAALTISACIADHNNSGTVTVTDIFSFLSAWFAGNLSADANASGTVTVQDIFFFLSRWFAGC